MTAQQLKNAILQEAIEGRLVPQDPNDEPASVLLDRIRKEKQQLVKAGKLKKKDLEEKPISEDEIPFEIPDSWEWTYLGNVLSKLTDGSHNPPPNSGVGYPVISAMNIRNGEITLDNVQRYVTEQDFFKENPRTNISRGDIILGIIGGSIGNIAIYNHDTKVIAQRSIAIMTPLLINHQYTLYILKSPLVVTQLSRYASGSAQGGVYLGNLKQILIPLPPLAEQKRIVAKIEELLPKVEKYGKAQDELKKLNEELPERLKKSILQEAIEGRLVPQDPNDEPASILLERIRKEKQQLVKEGKLKKKDFEEKPISEDEIPFEIPESWEWVRLGDVCDYLHRGKSPKYGTQKGLPIIAQKCNQWDKIYTDRCLFSDTAYIDKYALEQYLQVGDVIINSTGGGTVGRTGYVDTYVFDEYSHFVVDSHVTVVRGNKLIHSKYIYFFLISPYIQLGLEDRCSGSTNQIELGTTTISNYIFPLPPLAEQKRIVAKIEQLLGEINKLNA